jgi:uncharacterized protein with HEPN domain
MKTREDILQKVLNLRARADDSGSSEAEANAAFMHASKLMDAYNIEEAELAIAEATGKIRIEVIHKTADVTCLKGKRHRHMIFNCLSAISEFTHTKSVINSGSGKITYTGHRPDVEVANFLTSVIKTALDSEYEIYRLANPRVGYGAKSSFQRAMAYRVSRRLNAMAAEAEHERQRAKREAMDQIEDNKIATSTAIVVCDIIAEKKKEVNSAFKTKYPSLRNIGGLGGSSRNSTAHAAGAAAGNRVNLGKAISGSSRKMIA